MSRRLPSELESFLDKTERNIKRFEAMTGAFPAPVLNQWRYATRHVLTYGFCGDDSQLTQATNHIKRAYFDSCDIMVAALLLKLGQMLDPYFQFPEIPDKFIEAFRAKRKKITNAKSRYDSFMSFSPDEKAANYAEMESLADDLFALVLEIEPLLPDMAHELLVEKVRIGRQSTESFKTTVIAVSTAIATLVAVVTLILKFL